MLMADGDAKRSPTFPLNLRGATVNIFESTWPIYLKKRKTFRQNLQRDKSKINKEKQLGRRFFASRLVQNERICSVEKHCLSNIVNGPAIVSE